MSKPTNGQLENAACLIAFEFAKRKTVNTKQKTDLLQLNEFADALYSYLEYAHEQLKSCDKENINIFKNKSADQ